MKVALVAEWLDPWRGGAETSTQQFLHHLMDHGVEVHLFTRSRPSPAPGLSVHTIAGASMSRTRRSVTFAHRVERMLRAGAFDAIHAVSPCRGAHIYQPRGGTVAETIDRNLQLLRSGAARRLKQYANRLNFKQRHLRAMEREMLLRADGPIVVAISDYVVRQLKRHYGLADARIRKIYNGVNPDTSTAAERAAHRAAIRREYGIGESDLLVVMVAHNFRLKGVARWMEAMALLRRRGSVPHLKSLIIGKGEGPRWHRYASRLQIADRLTFAGPSERVSHLLHAGDALVHPTYYDPCSRVVLEAMVSGVPCITTRWDGAAEMIEDGANGFVLDDPGDVAGLADRVERLADAGVREAMRARAPAIAERVSMQRHTEEMLAVYESLAVTDAVAS